MFRLMNKLKNKKGFTLIELIVVLAVLGIIAAIAVPRFMAVQAQARIDADETLVQSIEKAGELWAIQTSADAADEITVASLQSLGYLDSTITWQSSGTGAITPVTKIVVNADGSATAQ